MPMKQITLVEMFGKGSLKKTAAIGKTKKRAATEEAEESSSKMKSFRPSASEERNAECSVHESPLHANNGQQEEEIPAMSSTYPNEGTPKPERTLPSIFSTLVDPGWHSLLEPELKKEYVKGICSFLEGQYNKGVTIFPPRDLIFNAFNLTPFNKIRVVLIGQDPYHNLRQAHGLCFSVPMDVPAPPSLKNIFKELTTEYASFQVPNHGCLESWAKQGVFLLNATLTVEAHKANSHSQIGWQLFTDAVIRTISERSSNGVVFLLWGGFAHRKEALVDKRKHRVIKAAHPSPLSAVKFFGCKCFSKTNAKLEELGREPIDWTAL